MACARTDRHADRAIAMGATAFFTNDENLRQNFIRHAGGPPEIVIECAGVPGMLDLCSDLVARRGRVIVAGGCNGVDPLKVLTPLCKEISFQFVICYSIREFALAEQLIASGRIDPMPMYDGLIPLHELPARFEELRRDKNACKVMVDLDA
ncbi:zinc-binding dehydrogenase [Novosphingobium resinovorum]|uniref:zinc-binding dehydrogenase n=1 Tax=Novosphingobium resinovorum TaxID=158500 RepID=UPI002ED1B9C4